MLTSFGAADMHHAFIFLHKDGITFDIILRILGGLRKRALDICQCCIVNICICLTFGLSVDLSSD